MSYGKLNNVEHFQNLLLIGNNTHMHTQIYLSSRTIPPMIVAASRIKIPAEIKIGVANPRTRVASLSGFGNLAGASVASKKPSGNSDQSLVAGNKSSFDMDKDEAVIVTCKCRRN